MFDFRRITLFCSEKHLSKHKMTICSENLGGHGPFGHPLAMPMGPPNALRFLPHKGNSLCYGKCQKLRLVGAAMLLFHAVKNTCLTAISNLCLTALPAKMPAFNSHIRQHDVWRN